MKKTRVLIVAGSMHFGGQENQLMHIIRNADKEQFIIDYTSTMPDAYYREEIESLGGHTIVIPSTNKGLLRYCVSLYRILKDGKYDVVHSNELFHSGLVVLLAAIAGVKVRITHSHSGNDGIQGKETFIRSFYYKLMRYFIMKYSTYFIACSSLAGYYLFGNDIEKKSNYKVLYNSVDTKLFLHSFATTFATNIKKQILIDTDEKKAVLHAGHIYRVKNQLFLAHLAKYFKEHQINCHIWCAGSISDEEYNNQVINYINSEGLSEYITFLGPIADMAELYSEADAYILPSLFEGMPLSLIEAQSSGLNCVVADTFSHEVDFNIGAVQWLSLSDSIDIWSNAICRAANSGRINRKNVELAIKKYGFDSKSFSHVICSIYKNDCN